MDLGTNVMDNLAGLQQKFSPALGGSDAVVLTPRNEAVRNIRDQGLTKVSYAKGQLSDSLRATSTQDNHAISDTFASTDAAPFSTPFPPSFTSAVASEGMTQSAPVAGARPHAMRPSLPLSFGRPAHIFSVHADAVDTFSNSIHPRKRRKTALEGYAPGRYDPNNGLPDFEAEDFDRPMMDKRLQEAFTPQSVIKHSESADRL